MLFEFFNPTLNIILMKTNFKVKVFHNLKVFLQKSSTKQSLEYPSILDKEDHQHEEGGQESEGATDDPGYGLCLQRGPVSRAPCHVFIKNFNNNKM